MGLDAWLAQALNNWAGTYHPLEVVAVLAASWLIWVLVVWYAAAFVWSRQGGWREFWTLALGVAMVYLTNILISVWLFRLRPFLNGVTQPLIYVNPLTKSFPSDHAAVAFFVAYLLVAHRRKWWWAYALALLVALGRILVGVHYPSDVLAGVVIGTAFGYLTVAVDKLFGPLPGTGKA